MYSAEQKSLMCEIAANLVAQSPGTMLIQVAANTAKEIVDAVEALEPPEPAADRPDPCQRLHLTLDQRAILNSALFELGQLIKDLAAYSSVRSWHDRAVGIRAKVSNVLTAPNISGEKGNTDAA